MTDRRYGFHEAISDFVAARQQAALQSVMAQLTGKSNELLSFEEVAQKLKLTLGAELGRRDIPLDAIVGSVGRYTDFSRTFLPLHDYDKVRWAEVKTAVESQEGVPPIDVYKVGEVYFVRDGNHRVSVARRLGATSIEANVIEVPTKVPLTPDVEPDDLILKAEQAAFLERTCLNELLPGVDFTLTEPGQYARLQEHIEVHRYYMGLDLKREVSHREAAQHWYKTVYLPLVLAIRDAGVLHGFPGRTETDLYLWVAEHRAALEEELGWHIRPEAAVTDLAVRRRAADADMTAVGGWRKSKISDRYTDRLFADILVPLNGETESWQALDQALLIARREKAAVHGLHVVAAEADAESSAARAIQAEFKKQCERAGVPGSLAVEQGEIARKICERALLTDLVVLNVAHPPAGLGSLGSGLRTIIWRCARPILAVPGWSTPVDRVMLAFDGSPKAREALFVATYVAERWPQSAALTVVSAIDGARVTPAVLTDVQRYLDLHEVAADLLSVSGPIAEAILTAAGERGINLLMLGGYGANPVKEVILGSTVNRVLREAHCPLFICH